MLFTRTLLFSSLILLATAQSDAVFKGLPGSGRTRTPTSTSKLMSRRDLQKRCIGTCEECFGAGYTLCPGSDLYCYLPGDATYGLDSCSADSSDGSDTTATASASEPTSTSTSGIDDICYQAGATCVSCFGAGYLDCPDGYHCYNPNDPLYDTCPDDGSSSGSSSNGTTTASSCADLYGDGNIPCGTDSCYNPDAGESCCAGGYYCDAGYSCSSTLGKCEYGSSGSGGSSYDTTTSDYTYATPTDGLVFSTPTTAATATTSDSSSSQTGVSQLSDSSDATVLGVAKGLLVAAGVGLLVL
ncbi:uncharacterized protein Z519_11646 [Cladophialophora bantiana CBS 173.52]|uniref:Uncharacterized protein n=1 Tax=Cladophialophora bantiana (strain ATCC 10958 / CBS 173.52 / CDC B-1940 / NIH 8579) TaxID=1442370 RepID=A0A0D2FLS7_CLAB1|nr:uncharacterized protein Z519_11646 [Cladophialophora bantiana CBS 173.52]KIW87672.1 hypothetical protein Z519_11646 [Cladophialophora bantiana CBS 173.52]